MTSTCPKHAQNVSNPRLKKRWFVYMCVVCHRYGHELQDAPPADGDASYMPKLRAFVEEAVIDAGSAAAGHSGTAEGGTDRNEEL